jgi:hypothetical protein
MHDSPTTDTGIGLHYVDLESAGMRPGAVLQFTFLWLESDRWEGKNFGVEVEGNLPEPKNAEAAADTLPIVARISSPATLEV